jgi:molecular chaperone GrpE
MGDDDFVDEVNFEPDEELGDVAGAQAKIKKLREELKETQKKRDEYLDGWQRCKADAINGRKEALSEADRRAIRVKESLLEDLIPALDSFDMAIGSEDWSDISDGWRRGMEHVRNQLLEALSRNGIERFAKIGDMFDPRMHEAVQEVDDVPGEPHTIVKILRFGYRASEKTLRPAQVIVKTA